MIKRLALSGQLKSGKDYVANQCGYTVVGFADPIYALVKVLLGTSDKNIPGVRRMLQLVGQWGRGIVSEEYPLTLERASTTKWIKYTGAVAMPPGTRYEGVNW